MNMTRAEAIEYRKKIEEAANYLPDESALDNIMLFAKWEPKAYKAGDRCRHNGVLYRCYRDISGGNPTWTPDVTTPHWEVVALPSEEGTKNNPITAAVNMRYYKDLYYLETKNDGTTELYLCTRDDSNGEGTLLAYLPSQLVNIYFTLVTD